jgi:hypothetical protein
VEPIDENKVPETLFEAMCLYPGGFDYQLPAPAPVIVADPVIAGYLRGSSAGKSFPIKELVQIVEASDVCPIPTFTWTEKMPAFYKYWHQKIHGFLGEAKPRLQTWTSGGYPYWTPPDFEVTYNGKLLTQGLDFYGRVHNGFIVKRSAFLGVYQFGVHEPSYFKLVEPSRKYSHVIFHRERHRVIHDTLFGDMSDERWNKLIENGDLTISPSGTFVTLNYKTQGGSYNNRQKRRSR